MPEADTMDDLHDVKLSDAGWALLAGEELQGRLGVPEVSETSLTTEFLSDATEPDESSWESQLHTHRMVHGVLSSRKALGENLIPVFSNPFFLRALELHNNQSTSLEGGILAELFAAFDVPAAQAAGKASAITEEPEEDTSLIPSSFEVSGINYAREAFIKLEEHYPGRLRYHLKKHHNQLLQLSSERKLSGLYLAAKVASAYPPFVLRPEVEPAISARNIRELDSRKKRRTAADHPFMIRSLRSAYLYPLFFDQDPVIEFSDNSIHIQSRPNEVGTIDKMTYAYYLHKNWRRLDTRWYDTKPSHTFEDVPGPGKYYVACFARYNKKERPLFFSRSETLVITADMFVKKTPPEESLEEEQSED